MVLLRNERYVLFILSFIFAKIDDFFLTANISSAFIKLNMVDLNRQAKMYSQGMAPVYKIVPGKLHWERIRDKPIYNVNTLILFWFSDVCDLVIC